MRPVPASSRLPRLPVAVARYQSLSSNFGSTTSRRIPPHARAKTRRTPPGRVTTATKLKQRDMTVAQEATRYRTEAQQLGAGASQRRHADQPAQQFVLATARLRIPTDPLVALRSGPEQLVLPLLRREDAARPVAAPRHHDGPM